VASGLNQLSGPIHSPLPGTRRDLRLTVGLEMSYRLTAMDDRCSHPCSCETSPAPTGLLVGTESGDSELAVVAKALGHPVRVQILRTLLEQRACFCGELVAALPLAQSTVSEHLRILREAGLIQGDIDGPRVCYCARPERLLRFLELADALVGTRAASALEAVPR
jgi:ArsR family transcriptional regulator